MEVLGEESLLLECFLLSVGCCSSWLMMTCKSGSFGCWMRSKAVAVVAVVVVVVVVVVGGGGGGAGVVKWTLVGTRMEWDCFSFDDEEVDDEYDEFDEDDEREEVVVVCFRLCFLLVFLILGVMFFFFLVFLLFPAPLQLRG
jgi:hypothetical protein